MNKQFAKLKVFELGGIAFCEETETVPFMVLPKGQATIKPWGPSGFVFENIITGDVVAFVANYDDILDSAGVEYDVTQLAVLTALAAFFFELGGGAAADLATVLIAGNSAGATDIDLNNNDLLNVDTITASGDLTLNPVGSIDANGKTLNMTAGEIHNVPLIHSQNNIDLTIEGKGTADLILKTNNVERLRISDSGIFTGLPNPEGWNVIVKSANQDVTNSTTLVDDTELQFSVVLGGQYMIELDAVISANSTANDYKNAFAVSSGTMKGSGILTANSAGTVAQATNILASAAAVTNSSGIGTALADLDLLHSIKIIYSFTASANATFKYQFAQNSAGVATTARTLKGSILKYKKIN